MNIHYQNAENRLLALVPGTPNRHRLMTQIQRFLRKMERKHPDDTSRASLSLSGKLAGEKRPGKYQHLFNEAERKRLGKPAV